MNRPTEGGEMKRDKVRVGHVYRNKKGRLARVLELPTPNGYSMRICYADTKRETGKDIACFCREFEWVGGPKE